MDTDRARDLLTAERQRLQSLLDDVTAAGRDDRTGGDDVGDSVDPAESLHVEAVDDAVATGLREKLAALERAEQRLADGTYGVSVRSGDSIPDERLEADPTAELTVEEAAADEAG